MVEWTLGLVLELTADDGRVARELRQRCTLEATEGADALVDPKIVTRRRSVRNKARE